MIPENMLRPMTHIECGNKIIRCDQIALVAWGMEAPTHAGKPVRGVEDEFAVRIWMFGDGEDPSILLSGDQASDFLGLYRRLAGVDRTTDPDLDDHMGKFDG